MPTTPERANGTTQECIGQSGKENITSTYTEEYPSRRPGDMLREAYMNNYDLAMVMHEFGAGNVRDLCLLLADAIDDCYRPVPLMEDGHPLRTNTETKYGKIERFEIYEDGNWLIRPEDGDIVEGTYSQRIPLPIAKMLDADDEEIREGDLVYTPDGDEAIVTTLYGEGLPLVEVRIGDMHVDFNPKELTHQEPDTADKFVSDINEYLQTGIFYRDDNDEFERRFKSLAKVGA